MVKKIAYREIKHNLTEENELGKGGYGTVYRGIWRDQPVAIKKLSQVVRDSFFTEATTMMEVESPYIVTLFAYCLSKRNNYLVMELMPNGSLYDLLHSLHNGKKLPWQQGLLIAGDIAQGVEDLHEQDVLHRDLKSLNVVLSSNLRAKLCDFGLAKDGVRSGDGPSLSILQGAVGTQAWIAPEMLMRLSCTKESDVYMMGKTLAEIGSGGQLPTAGQPLVEMRGSCPKPFMRLIIQCQALAPAARPTATKVVRTIKKILAPPAPKPAAHHVAPPIGYQHKAAKREGILVAPPLRPVYHAKDSLLVQHHHCQVARQPKREVVPGFFPVPAPKPSIPTRLLYDYQKKAGKANKAMMQVQALQPYLNTNGRSVMLYNYQRKAAKAYQALGECIKEEFRDGEDTLSLSR